MSRPVLDHTADVTLLQALTTWLNSVALVRPGSVTGKLTPHMVNAYHIAPGSNATDDDIHRVIRAAGKAVSAVHEMEAEKENLVAQVNEQEQEAHAAHATRKQRDLAKAQVDKIAEQVAKAEQRVKHRTDTNLAKAQLAYHDAYHAAASAVTKHRKDTASDERKADKQQRQQLRQQAREHRLKQQQDEADAALQQREFAAKAKADNEEKSRAFNKKAAALVQHYSKKARKRRNEIEINTLRLQKRLIALTEAELAEAGLPDPAPELNSSAEEKSAEHV